MTTGILARLGFGSQQQEVAKERKLGTSSIGRIDRKQLFTDLFTQVSYMASLATAKASRDIMFTRAATLNLSSTPYFIEINTLVHRLKYDYSQACLAVAERTKEPEVSSLLMRMSGSLSSGEDEEQFLVREAAVMAEIFEAQYERDVESLRKWTDAYSALLVSAGLIVVVSIISMMIWTLGPTMILGTAFAAIMVSAVGTWIIHAAAPTEQFTRKAGLSSGQQLLSLRLLKTIAPVGAVIGIAIWAVTGQFGLALVAAGVGLLPAGWYMNRDAARVARLDGDIAAALRMLGGVTSAIGTTVRDALTKIDRRSLGKLEPHFRRLQVRLNASISPDLCWDRFTVECGSELIERSKAIFWDALTIGGEPGQTGRNAAFFAGKLALLRAKRALVASTFGYLVLPLHAAMCGLLIFIINVMALFAQSLAVGAPDVPEPGESAAAQSIAAVAGYNSFADLDFQFLNLLVTVIVVVFTVSNSVAPWGASGGHRIRGLFLLGQMMIVAGLMIAVVPPVSNSIFSAISAPAR
jgi:flagellar protein FlaJ